MHSVTDFTLITCKEQKLKDIIHTLRLVKPSTSYLTLSTQFYKASCSLLEVCRRSIAPTGKLLLSEMMWRGRGVSRTWLRGATQGFASRWQQLLSEHSWKTTGRTSVKPFSLSLPFTGVPYKAPPGNLPFWCHLLRKSKKLHFTGGSLLWFRVLLTRAAWFCSAQ